VEHLTEEYLVGGRVKVSPDAKVRKSETEIYPWNSPIPIVYVEGSGSEMGRQFGAATSDIIKRVVKFNVPRLEKILSESALTKEDYLRKAEEDVARFTTSEYLDEIASMAEAASVSYKDLLLTNVNIDILYTLPEPEVHGQLFCSYFAAWGKATVDGSVIAGHNDDGGRYMDQFLVLKIARPNRGHPFASPIVPGYIGYHSAVNSTQTYCCSTGISDVMRNSELLEDAVPSWFLFRWLGQFSDGLDDAVNRFLSAPNMTCINWCFTGKNGARIIEATPRHHAFARFPDTSGDWIVSAGKTLCEELEPYLVQAKHPDMGDYRYDSLIRAIKMNLGRIDTETAKRIMSDHYDSSSNTVSASENTVCRHMEYIGSFAGTCRSLVVRFTPPDKIPLSTELFLALGNPCNAYWRRIVFDESFNVVSLT
jgi:hypothetical protein